MASGASHCPRPRPRQVPPLSVTAAAASSVTRTEAWSSSRPPPAGWAAAGSSTTTKPTRSRPTSRSSTQALSTIDETDLVNWGVTAITRYDPLSRAIRVDNPNGTSRTVEFDPWRQISFDENDTVLASGWYQARQAGRLGPAEADAAAKAAAHAATPSVTDLDTLGRAFRTVVDNGPGGQYPTVLGLDIEGNVRTTTDALGRAILTQDYSLAGTEIHILSVDAGERWLTVDAASQPLRTWDSRAVQIRHGYDALRRPATLHVTQGEHSRVSRRADQLRRRPNRRPGPQPARRRLPAPDEAGVATTIQRDFKGNVLSASRQLLQDFSVNVDWTHNPGLDAETFTTATTYDALNRIVTVTSPDASVTSPVYNERSLLAQMSVSLAGATATSFVTGVTYDPKGQRQVITYGNGAITSYAYEPDTFRLVRIRTSRPSAGNPLQDLTYSYDPIGNITRITDAAQQTIFFANQIVTASADYTYDAVYRLTRATGREHIGQVGQSQTSWDDSAMVRVPLPTDGQAMRNYIETYTYDQVGNITSVVHSAANGNWTRAYAYGQTGSPSVNNHLTSTIVGQTVSSYTYDPNGNTTSMPHLQLMAWDWKNQLQATSSQVPADGAHQITYYQYNSAGKRIRKVTASQTGAPVSQRSYLGSYEVYREYSPNGAITLERQSLHVSGGANLICLAETTTIDESAASGAMPSSLSRYQLGNLLGSAVLELDPAAAIISYEEYYPYGSTSFQTGRSAAEVSLKRYRYTGKERDTETGLYYHGARYYAPWLARWASCDPVGLADGLNLYAYVRANPIQLTDPTGCAGKAPEPHQMHFIERPGYAIDATATATTPGFGPEHYEHVGKAVRDWGAPGTYDLGHPQDQPFATQKPGQTVKVRLEASGVNRRAGARSRPAIAAAKKAGIPVRDPKTGYYPGATKGVRYKPKSSAGSAPTAETPAPPPAAETPAPPPAARNARAAC